jgi:uncharacterized protein with FMN-binding domain
MENTQNKGNTIVIIVVILAVAIGAYYYFNKNTGKNTETTNPTPVGTTTDNKKFLYKDGSYSATGSYVSPGGAESIKITLVLKDDIITDASAEVLATRPTSKQMQIAFASGFKAMIVGKNINDVTLDKVSGSSLTPQGFNDAVAKIKAQARI